jgi:hypothetical protein
MEPQHDTLQLSASERITGLMKAKASAERLRAQGRPVSRVGREQSTTLASARSAVQGWPEAPQAVAEKLLEHYGAPHEATPTKLFWYDVGPWSRMELTADEVVHHFPTPHTDFLSQYVYYPVPPARAADLVQFDGSVLVDRTTGELGARCDHEPFNILTLNLAVEIAEGRRTVNEARDLYAETASAYLMGRDAPYAERLLFDPQDVEAADPDEATVAPAMVDQMVEKVKDIAGEGDTPR